MTWIGHTEILRLGKVRKFIFKLRRNPAYLVFIYRLLAPPPHLAFKCSGIRISTLTTSKPGTRLFGQAVLVTGYFGRDISVHKQLIIFVYLNDYIGWRNVTLAGVIPTAFDVAAK